MVSLDQKDNVRSLINALPIAVAVVEDGCLASGNSTFQDLWQLEDKYLEQHPTLSAFLDHLREHRLLPEQNDFAKFRGAICERANSNSESSETWYLPNGAAFNVKFAPLKIGRSLFIIEDLSPQLLTERAMNALEQTQQVTLDHLQEGLAVFGGDGLLKLHNSAFAEIWQLPEDALSGDLHMTDFLDATRKILPVFENWPERRVKLSGRLLGRKSGSDQIVCKGGKVVEAAHIPLPDGAVLLRYADISDSVTLEETLRSRASEMAERAELMAAADRLKSEFLANLSHELRTPLTAISGFAELLAGDYFGNLNRRQQEYADGIVNASEAVTGLIDDILDLASVEAGLLELDLESIDLHASLAEIVKRVGERARHKKLKVQFDCPIDIGWIEADEKRFKQCLLHLLSNAITFSTAGGTISIAAQRKSTGIEIVIQDTGIGIPKVDLERVFKGFERGAAADSLKPGAGLGLTLVRAFIELQGGQVKIASKPNQGTTVSLFLPSGKAFAEPE